MAQNKALDESGLLYFGQQMLAKLKEIFVGKEAGKGLSTNDFTTALKDKLDGIAAGAGVNVNADWDAASGDARILNKPSIPSKTSDLTNDSGFITSADVPDGASASRSAPLMDGEAQTGTETAFARGDHRHPTDTSRAPVASPAFSGTPTAPTAAAGTDTTQIATTAFVKAAIDAAFGAVSGAYVYKGSVTYANLPSAGMSAGDVYNVTDAHGNYPAGTNYAWTGSEWDPLGGEFSIEYLTNQEVLAVVNEVFGE